jgi:hypothetical protein
MKRWLLRLLNAARDTALRWGTTDEPQPIRDRSGELDNRRAANDERLADLYEDAPEGTED